MAKSRLILQHESSSVPSCMDCISNRGNGTDLYTSGAGGYSLGDVPLRRIPASHVINESALCILYGFITVDMLQTTRQ